MKRFLFAMLAPPIVLAATALFIVGVLVVPCLAVHALMAHGLSEDGAIALITIVIAWLVASVAIYYGRGR